MGAGELESLVEDKENESAQEETATISIQKDAYGLAVALHYNNKPKLWVVLSLCLAISIFFFQLWILLRLAGHSLYTTVNNHGFTIHIMQIVFLFMNWTVFQLPNLTKACNMFLMNNPLADVLGFIQMLLVLPVAYFSACLVISSSTPVKILFSYLKLGVVMVLDDTLFNAGASLINYYMGDDWVSKAISFEMKVKRATVSRMVFQKMKLAMPFVLLLVSMFRVLETTGPLEFTFPQGEGNHNFYSDMYFHMGKGLAYTPPKSLNLTKRCAEDDGRIPVTTSYFRDAATRVNEVMAKSNIICQPHFALVPEPTTFASAFNIFARMFSFIDRGYLIEPEAGPMARDYLEDGDPGNKDGDKLQVGYCGVCSANSMKCIPADNKDCSHAADYLNVDVAGEDKEDPYNKVGSLLDDAKARRHEIDHYDSFVKPLLHTLDRESCKAKPRGGYKAFQSWFVTWHICEVP